MSSTVSPVPNSASNAAQTPANAASNSASGTTSPLGAVPAQPTARSYANATKKQLTPPAIASSSPPVAVGGSQPVQQHAKSNSVSPVNGKNTNPPAVPAVAPAIVHSNPVANGAPAQADHGRKSSVTISPSQGYPNGGSVASNNRASIQFGSMGGSPAIANSVPHTTQNPSLPAPQANPRVISPANSPSPIPQPLSASGGRPPSMGSQGMSVNFGATGGDSNDANMRAVTMPQGPAAGLAPQAQHLRRESSQSAHSDMSAGPMNRQFSGGNGRGRGYQPNYGPQMTPSPVPAYRQLHPQQRGPQNMPPFQPQAGPMRVPGSPYQANASPSMRPAIPHQSPHLANGAPMMYGAYPQHLQPQQSVYGMPQPYDQQFAQYYGQQPYMHTTMQYPGPPASPRPQFNAPHAAQAAYVQGSYGPPMNAQGMVRSASQGPDRPPSAMNQPPTPSMQPSMSHTPNQSSGSPGPTTPSSNFTIPSKKKSNAIRITNAQGEAISFQKPGSASPAPVASSQPQPPAVVSSTPTPPPKSATPQAPADKEAPPTKTKEEIQAEFMKAVRAQTSEEQPKEEAAKPKEEPVTEAPKAEAPKTEAPKTEAPKAEAPRAEAPKAEAPKVEAAPEPPKAEAKTEAKAEVAAEKPAEEAPKVESEPVETEEERKKREEDEEMERMIAEMEAMEKEEEEREKAFQEKKKLEAAERKRKEEEAKANEDEELKRQEREAEAAEEAREKAREHGPVEDESEEAKAERQKLFASLKKPTFGPGALAASAEGSGVSGTSTPSSEVATPPPAQQSAATPTIKTPSTAGKPKPAALKLETTKPVEPAQPTAGMQSLKSARFLQVKDIVKYPEGIQSPNPAMNVSAKARGRQYDKNFLLQFQEVFKEKPSIDWDNKVRETVGDGSTDSARPQSARTPSGMGRQASRGGIGGMAPPMAMGSFGGAPGRTLPPGTTSAERFRASNVQGGMPMGGLGSFSRPGGMPNAPVMARNPSQSSFQPARGLDSPRTGSSRRGGSKKSNPREEAEKAAKMPLTAGQELKPLEHSNTGWKASSLTAGPAANPLPGGRLPPDVVQRKVKSALNKMTPEKFDKISDDILVIAAQSKDETDGRTLRQVIQLTFEKACDEAHWSSMYANFCKRMLETMSPEIKDENVKDRHGSPVVGGALFRKYLLNRCQEEFERGWEVNLPEPAEGQGEAVMLSDEYYVAAAAKRRGLGLIQFIGELFKLGMLTPRIMHECVYKLLNFEGTPDEAAIESLVKLLRTIGARMEAHEADNPGSPSMIRVYFERIDKILGMQGLPSRSRYMLMDIIDLRKNGWRSKDDAKGPKTISEIHQEAAAAHQAAELERQRLNQRGGGNRPQMGRGDARSFSSMQPAQDYRGSNQVNIEDLKKLTRGSQGRNVSSGPGNFGPSSLLGSRSNSGRKGLGPGSSRAGEDSGLSSRTGTPPAEKKEPSTSVNAFSALASLGDGEGADDVASPPSNASSPPVAKTTPAGAADSRPRSKSPLGERETGEKP